MKTIQFGFDFYYNLMFPRGNPKPYDKGTSATLTKVSITIASDEIPRDYTRNNETYFVGVTQEGIEVNSYNRFGCMRAFATLS